MSRLSFVTYTFLVLILIVRLTNGDSSDPRSLCRGKANGRYADTSDCNHYTQCFGGVQFLSKCPMGHNFDKVVNKCMKGVEFPCNATEKAKSLIGVHCYEEGQIIPSAVYCERFLVCRYGLYYPIYCPPGLLFSNKENQCIDPPNPCDTEFSIKQRQKNPPERKKSPYIGVCDNKIGRNISEPLHCSMYISCIRHKTKNTSVVLVSICESGLFYSDDTEMCEKPAGVICGTRFRNKYLYGKDPTPDQVKKYFRSLYKMSDENLKMTTEGPEGRAFNSESLVSPAPDEEAKPTAKKSSNRHRIVIHDVGDNNDESSETFILKMIVPRGLRPHGKNTPHRHIVVEEESSEKAEKVKIRRPKTPKPTTVSSAGNRNLNTTSETEEDTFVKSTTPEPEYDDEDDISTTTDKSEDGTVDNKTSPVEPAGETRTHATESPKVKRKKTGMKGIRIKLIPTSSNISTLNDSNTEATTEKLTTTTEKPTPKKINTHEKLTAEAKDLEMEENYNYFYEAADPRDDNKNLTGTSGSGPEPDDYAFMSSFETAGHTGHKPRTLPPKKVKAKPSPTV